MLFDSCGMLHVSCSWSIDGFAFCFVQTWEENKFDDSKRRNILSAPAAASLLNYQDMLFYHYSQFVMQEIRFIYFIKKVDGLYPV